MDLFTSEQFGEIQGKLDEIIRLLKAAPSKMAALTDEVWLNDLCQDQTYKGIDVRNEFGKCARWCQQHGKKPTRNRFINWLNKAERPLMVQVPKVPQNVPPVYVKPVEQRPAGEAPDAATKEKLSKFLGAKWGEM